MFIIWRPSFTPKILPLLPLLLLLLLLLLLVLLILNPLGQIRYVHYLEAILYTKINPASEPSMLLRSVRLVRSLR